MTRLFSNCWIFWPGFQNILFSVCTMNRYLGAILFCRGCDIAGHFLIIVTVKSFNTARQTSFIGPLFFEPQLKCCKVLGWRYIALSVLQLPHCGGEREDTIFNCSCIVAWKERERERKRCCEKWFQRNTISWLALQERSICSYLIKMTRCTTR